jgi:AraC-like DNA-binding protein
MLTRMAELMFVEAVRRHVASLSGASQDTGWLAGLGHPVVGPALHALHERPEHGAAKVASIGARVGYDSEAAFSRAFKRATGLSPSAWRARRSARQA